MARLCCARLSLGEGSRGRPRGRDPGALGGGARGQLHPRRDPDPAQRMPPAEAAEGLVAAGGNGPEEGIGTLTEDIGWAESGGSASAGGRGSASI